MSLGTILEIPEHEFDDEDWEEDEEFGTDEEELDVDEFDEGLEDEGDEDDALSSASPGLGASDPARSRAPTALSVGARSAGGRVPGHP
jgi:hypothetical protein